MLWCLVRWLLYAFKGRIECHTPSLTAGYSFFSILALTCFTRPTLSPVASARRNAFSRLRLNEYFNAGSRFACLCVRDDIRTAQDIHKPQHESLVIPREHKFEQSYAYMQLGNSLREARAKNFFPENFRFKTRFDDFSQSV